TMHHQAAGGGHLLHVRESGCEERVPLFGDRHVEPIILEAALTEEVIAHQIQTSRLQNSLNGGVKLWGTSLVPQFMHRLVRNHGIEEPEALRPVRLRETALNEGRARCARAESRPREIMQGNGKIQECQMDLRKRIE